MRKMICERNIKNEDWKSCKKVSTIEKMEESISQEYSLYRHFEDWQHLIGISMQQLNFHIRSEY